MKIGAMPVCGHTIDKCGDADAVIPPNGGMFSLPKIFLHNFMRETSNCRNEDKEEAANSLQIKPGNF